MAKESYLGLTDARKAAETKLGRSMSDSEWIQLVDVTKAEASNNSAEQGYVMAAVVNRARDSNGTIEQVITAPLQFEAVTGDPKKGTGASVNFTREASQNQLDSISRGVTSVLPDAPNDLKNFTSANPAAYSSLARGTSYINDKLSKGWTQVGGSLFGTSSGPSPLGGGVISGITSAASGAISQGATAIASLPSSALKAFTGNTKIGKLVSLGGTVVAGQEDEVGLVRNPLEKFSSFNTIFTLSCLNSEEVNFPDSSYKQNNLGKIVFRSGGGQPDNRVSTAFTSSYNKEGKFEYYIDNFVMNSIMTYDKRTQGTNATRITFDIYEPYSLGLLLQSLELAAFESGHPNYTTAPFLLTIEFVGYDANGIPIPVNDVLNRHIPIKILKLDLEVTASGSKYAVTAMAWNELVLTDLNVLLKEDMNISGATVAEALQSGKNSLQYWLNTKLQNIASTVEDKSLKPAANPDEIVIIFPKEIASADSNLTRSVTDTGAPATVNPTAVTANNSIESKLTLTRNSKELLVQDKASLGDIGASSFRFDSNYAGEPEPVDPADSNQDHSKPFLRKSAAFKADSRSFRFPQGTSIVDAITEIVLMSDYAKKNVFGKSDRPGFKKWFRVETQLFLLEPTLANLSKGGPPKLMVYRVVPYYVHESKFSSPTSAPMGYEQMKKAAPKEYTYIYSGANVDVLSFNLKFNTASFTTLYADKNSASWTAYQQAKGAALEKQEIPDEKNTTPKSDEGLGTPQVGSQASRPKSSGGSGADDFKSLVAKNFQDAILNHDTSLIQAELEILGDPYFIADSGLGNFSDKPKNFNVNQNGSMNYQSGDVDILINFRTPVDYDPATGQADFGSAIKVEPFSGLYQVITVTNTVNRGKFTQQLKIIRRPNQEPEKAATPNAPVAAAPAAASVNDAASVTTSPASPTVEKSVDASGGGEEGTGRIELAGEADTSTSA